MPFMEGAASIEVLLNWRLSDGQPISLPQIQEALRRPNAVLYCPTRRAPDAYPLGTKLRS